MLSVIHAPWFIRVVLLMLVVMRAGAALGQTTSFTYQGQLRDAGALANGSYDLRFALFDSAAGGAQIGANESVPAVSVSNGVFSVPLDFGIDAFPGANRFVEIGVKPAGGGSFTTLAPRQQITSTPYAFRCLTAASADSVAVAGVPAGNSNYIQNANSAQPGTNFSISGNGTAGGTLTGNVVNAITQFDLGGKRVLTVNGTASFPDSNTFAGIGAGAANNLDIGDEAGILNSFFGSSAGEANASGDGNSFFGFAAGEGITTGSLNAFVGTNAGVGVDTGSSNTFIGAQAGAFEATGVASGDQNTLLGARATVDSGVSNSTAIGFQARVTQSNSLVLGRIAGVNGADVDTDVGIGTTAPTARLHVVEAPFNGRAVTATLAGASCSGAYAVGGCTPTQIGVLGRSDSGQGVQGQATTGIGVLGNGAARGVVGTLNSVSCPGVFGLGGCSTDQTGVLGRSDSFRGVQGLTTTGIGVFGNGNARGVVGTLGATSCAGTYGVGGCSVDQTGVLGSSDTGIGVIGRTTSGNIFVGVGGGTNRARIDSAGKGFFNGGTQVGGADFAESMPVQTDVATLEPGDVLVLDPAHPGAVKQSQTVNSRLVAGVYSTQPSVLSTGDHGIDDSLEGEVPVAIVGIVPTKVTAENGAISIGDLLVTASVPGHAMKAAPLVVDGVQIYAVGTILGKALAPFEQGVGVIKVLVTLK